MSVSNNGAAAEASAAAQAMAGGVKGVDAAGNWTRPGPDNESSAAGGSDGDPDIEAILDGLPTEEQETAASGSVDPETGAEYETFDDEDDGSDDTTTLSDDKSAGQVADGDDEEDDAGSDKLTEAQKLLRELLGIDDELENEQESGSADNDADKSKAETQKDESLTELSAAARELYDKAGGRASSLAKSLADSQDYIAELERKVADHDQALAEAIPAFDEAGYRTRVKAKIDADDRYSDFSEEEIKETIDALVSSAKANHEAQTSTLKSTLSDTTKKLREKQQKEAEAKQKAAVETWSKLSEMTGGDDVITTLAFNVHLQDNVPLKQAAHTARDQFERAILNHVQKSASFGKTFTDGILSWIRESNAPLAKSILASAVRGVIRRAPNSVSSAKQSNGTENNGAKPAATTNGQRKPTPKAKVNKGKLSGVATPMDIEAETERLELELTKQLTARNRRRSSSV